MKHYDYEWDCDSTGIKLDEEFNSDRLGWKHGDYFRFQNINGRQQLVKVSDLEKFIKDGENKRTG